jgi:hypothetical protein
LASNIAQNVFLPGVLDLRFGMTREEVFKTCPSLEYDAAFGRKYFLPGTSPIILQKELKGIEFSGGFPKPSRETVNATVEWLLAVFGTPDTAFEELTKDGGRFGLVWKRSDLLVASWFVSSELSARFNAFLKLVPVTSNMDRILTSRGGRELPKASPSVLASFKIWSQTVARLESKGPSPYASVPSTIGQPTNSLELLNRYEVLSGEGLSGSAFVIRYRNTLYGVSSIHQFEGKTPGSLEPLQGASIQLEKVAAIRQADVQVIPIRSAQPQVQHLAYNPDFTLLPGEEVYILGPAGGVELGMLATTQMPGGRYRSASGPKKFGVRMAKPFVAAGGSGCPVVQKSTGAVVGVLLSADNGEKARFIEFETLCLPK